MYKRLTGNALFGFCALFRWKHLVFLYSKQMTGGQSCVRQVRRAEEVVVHHLNALSGTALYGTAALKIHSHSLANLSKVSFKSII